MSAYYPMMVDLSGRKCVIIGGGRVAQRKIQSLLQVGADILVISPEWLNMIESWVQSGKISGARRRYQTGDCVDAFLVIAATNSEHVNRQVYQDIDPTWQFVNIVDQPKLCNYIVPAVTRRGKLILTVSTSGASPALASRISRNLEQQFGPEYETYLDLLDILREKLKQMIDDTDRRQKLYRQIIEMDLLEQIRHNQNESLEKLCEAILQSFL